MFHRNVGWHSTDYMALYPGRCYCSVLLSLHVYSLPSNGQCLKGIWPMWTKILPSFFKKNLKQFRFVSYQQESG
jgi:hypothetical protein